VRFGCEPHPATTHSIASCISVTNRIGIFFLDALHFTIGFFCYQSSKKRSVPQLLVEAVIGKVRSGTRFNGGGRFSENSISMVEFRTNFSLKVNSHSLF
jgi:hypothetical protein